MSTNPGFSLTRYAPWRRWVEIGGTTLLYLTNATANSITSGMDIRRAGLDWAAWGPWVWEFSSNLVLLALIPAVLWFEGRLPLQRGAWRRNWRWHLLASVAYSLVHVVTMVQLRYGAYALMHSSYDFGDWPREMFYEYLKDIRSYAMVLAVVYLYRLLLLRLQGEASLLDAPDDDTPPVEPVDRPERFLVRKLGREFLIAARDIEYVQACGNYVNLHVHGRDYPLRSTIGGVEERLDPTRFLRVHRSYILNLDHLASIEPLDTGDARLHLRDGGQVPCSRRYRALLRERVSGDAANDSEAA
jgi:DNA-binding LytR/AlgR family response regulator